MRHPSFYSFCPYCATPLEPTRSDGFARRRCPGCGWIQYRNPTVGVAVVVRQQQRLLLGRRRDGGWCIPCGHVEWDESIEAAAIRELQEETGLTVALHGILAVKSNFHDRHRQTVGIWFRGVPRAGALRAGGDLLEVDYYDLHAPPALRFPTDREVLAQLCGEAR